MVSDESSTQPATAGDDATGLRPHRRVKLLVTVAAVILGVDIVTKVLAVRLLTPGQPVSIIGESVTMMRLALLGCEPKAEAPSLNDMIGATTDAEPARIAEIFDHENRLPTIPIPDVSKQWPPNNKTNNIRLRPGISMTAFSLRIFSDKAVLGS